MLRTEIVWLVLLPPLPPPLLLAPMEITEMV